MNLVRYAFARGTKMDAQRAFARLRERSLHGAGGPPHVHYKIVINVLLRKRRSILIGRMASKFTLALGTALAAIAFCCFVESSFGQDALVASLDATENDDRDGDDKDDKDEKSRSSRTRTSSSVVSRFLTRPGDNLSLGLTSVGDTVEADTVVVTGTWFDAYPVPYPALPPVEG